MEISVRNDEDGGSGVERRRCVWETSGKSKPCSSKKGLLPVLPSYLLLPQHSLVWLSFLYFEGNVFTAESPAFITVLVRSRNSINTC